MQWEEEYRNLLKRSQPARNKDSEPSGDERREQPRFRLKSEFVWIKVQPRFAVVDVSIAGISFYSTIPFDADSTLSITLGKAFSVEAKVLECDMVESDPALLEAQYLVRCVFHDKSTGMQFLVMIKEMDDLKIHPG